MRKAFSDGQVGRGAASRRKPGTGFVFPTDDYRKGARRLSWPARGAYLEILILLWHSDSAEIPAEDNQIAQLLRVNPRTWRAWRKELVEQPFTRMFVIEDGLLSSPTLSAQRSRVASKSETRQRSSLSRWLGQGLLPPSAHRKR
jgi:hypothetical protein